MATRGRTRKSNGANSKHPALEPDAAAPEGLRATTFECGADTFAILSFPELDPPLPDVLSAAEAEVCRLLLTGLSNAEVARQRGTSERTVANQVASILKKLGAGSRSELPIVLSRRNDESHRLS
jgi:DNA-binding CsgD family transcriptional regulator